VAHSVRDRRDFLPPTQLVAMRLTADTVAKESVVAMQIAVQDRQIALSLAHRYCSKQTLKISFLFPI
jgi:hypothetical protein